MPSKPSTIPDMRYINRQVPIGEVSRALELRLDGTSKIHCWHPDRHQHGDRTASVGIRTANNTVKCFGCDSKPLGPIDLVMDVRELAAADAALWIAARFEVPTIPAGRRLEQPDRWRGPVGFERGLGLLIQSGLWATLSEAARAIAPVLLEKSEKMRPTDQEYWIQISYAGITRYSGICSPNAIRKALVELENCPWCGKAFIPVCLWRALQPNRLREDDILVDVCAPDQLNRYLNAPNAEVKRRKDGSIRFIRLLPLGDDRGHLGENHGRSTVTIERVRNDQGAPVGNAFNLQHKKTSTSWGAPAVKIRIETAAERNRQVQ